MCENVDKVHSALMSFILSFIFFVHPFFVSLANERFPIFIYGESRVLLVLQCFTVVTFRSRAHGQVLYSFVSPLGDRCWIRASVRKYSFSWIYLVDLLCAYVVIISKFCRTRFEDFRCGSSATKRNARVVLVNDNRFVIFFGQ